MITVTRSFEFDYGHRVLGHENKCRNLHGHRGKALVTLSNNDKLDNLGRIIDFSVVKELIGTWIDRNWDHNLLLNEDDPIFSVINNYINATSDFQRTPYLMKYGNPTAENMARELFDIIGIILHHNKKELRCVNVTLYETPNCYASYNKE